MDELSERLQISLNRERKKRRRRTGLILLAVAILSGAAAMVALINELGVEQQLPGVFIGIAFSAFVFSLCFLVAGTSQYPTEYYMTDISTTGIEIGSGDWGGEGENELPTKIGGNGALLTTVGHIDRQLETEIAYSTNRVRSSDNSWLRTMTFAIIRQ